MQNGLLRLYNKNHRNNKTMIDTVKRQQELDSKGGGRKEYTY